MPKKHTEMPTSPEEPIGAAAQDNDAEDDDLVLLEDEEGHLLRFTFLEMVETDGVPYAVLLPLDDEDEEQGVVIVEIVNLGKDSEHYDAVTDEQLLDRIFEQFRETFGDAYDFAD